MRFLSRWTVAWLVLTATLGLHVFEEATSSAYVGRGEALETLRLFLPWLPPFQPLVWLVNVAGAVVALFALTWLVARGDRVMRFASSALAAFTTTNAALHILLAIVAGHIVPGALTAPLLLLASLFLFSSIPRANAKHANEELSGQSAVVARHSKAGEASMRAQFFFTAALAFSLLGCIDDISPVNPARPGEDAAMQAALVEDGRAIAEDNCASCHAIGPTGQSPNPKAPPFRLVLSRYNASVLETELVEGMRVAHEPMPQFRFKPEAASALIAYLRSVQTRNPGQALVEQRCARCHAIAQTDTSPYPGAQPFRSLGRRWSRGQLRDALRTGIIAEHDKAEARVPPMKLTDAEIDAFLAYLDSIATRQNPAPKAP